MIAKTCDWPFSNQIALPYMLVAAIVGLSLAMFFVHDDAPSLTWRARTTACIFAAILWPLAALIYLRRGMVELFVWIHDNPPEDQT